MVTAFCALRTTIDRRERFVAVLLVWRVEVASCKSSSGFARFKGVDRLKRINNSFS